VLLTLVDSLRCPAGHEETSLVLSVESWSGQRVAEGLLGCPMCHSRYPIQQGTADFTGSSNVVRHAALGAPPDAMRLAAQLSLTEPGGILLLTGRYAACAASLVEFADLTCLLVDVPVASSPAAVDIRVNERLPLVDRALRGAAIDGARGDPVFLAEVARCVRPRGRIVAPNPSVPPGGSRIVARDEHEWVVEVEDFSAPVPLRRAQQGSEPSGL